MMTPKQNSWLRYAYVILVAITVFLFCWNGQRNLSGEKPAVLTTTDADIFFDRGEYKKSAEVYRQYLDNHPEDLLIRSRYAGALIFDGKGAEAIEELNQILSKDSGNFLALSYLAIAYGNAGNYEKAISVGEKAIAATSDPEAKDRLQGYLKSLSNQDVH